MLRNVMLAGLFGIATGAFAAPAAADDFDIYFAYSDGGYYVDPYPVCQERVLVRRASDCGPRYYSHGPQYYGEYYREYRGPVVRYPQPVYRPSHYYYSKRSYSRDCYVPRYSGYHRGGRSVGAYYERGGRSFRGGFYYRR